MKKGILKYSYIYIEEPVKKKSVEKQQFCLTAKKLFANKLLFLLNSPELKLIREES